MRINKLSSLEKLITYHFLHSISAVQLPFMSYGSTNRMTCLIKNEERCRMIFPSQRKSRTNNIQSHRWKSSRLDIRKYRSTAGIISRLQKQNHTNQLYRYWLWRLSGSCPLLETAKRIIQQWRVWADCNRILEP